MDSLDAGQLRVMLGKGSRSRLSVVQKRGVETVRPKDYHSSLIPLFRDPLEPHRQQLSLEQCTTCAPFPSLEYLQAGGL